MLMVSGLLQGPGGRGVGWRRLRGRTESSRILGVRWDGVLRYGEYTSLLPLVLIGSCSGPCWSGCVEYKYCAP